MPPGDVGVGAPSTTKSAPSPNPWPLPRGQQPAAVEASQPSAQNVARRPPERQQRPVPAQGAPRGTATPRRQPSTGQRSRGSPPQQRKPSQVATSQSQADPNFSFPNPPPQRVERRPSANQLNKQPPPDRRDPSIQPQQVQHPRPAPSGPVPAGARSVQPVQQQQQQPRPVQGRRPSAAQQQQPFYFSEQAGPPPSVPAPTPANLPQRAKTPDRSTTTNQAPSLRPARSQGPPPPQDPHQSTLPDELVPVALDLGTTADISRSRDMSPPPRRKPVVTSQYQAQTNQARSSPPNPPQQQQQRQQQQQQPRQALPGGFSQNLEAAPARLSPQDTNSKIPPGFAHPLRASPPTPHGPPGTLPAALFSQGSAVSNQPPVVLSSPPQTRAVPPLQIPDPPRPPQPPQANSRPFEVASAPRAGTFSHAIPPPRPGVASPPGTVYPPRPSPPRPPGSYTVPPPRAPGTMVQITSPQGSTASSSSTSPSQRGILSPPRPPPMPAPTYQQGGHTPSSSIDSTISAASSTRPLNPNPGSSVVQRQDFASPPPPGTRGLNVVNNGPTSAQYSSPIPISAPSSSSSSSDAGGAQQSRYITMLKSVEKIPRLHNILVLFFAWILLAGFVIMPGSFTSVKRAVDEASGIPINLGANRKLILSKANTATMVVGFVLTVAGTFGTAWLALRWRRNYVWLLNRIYMPLVLNSSIGFVSTIIGVYAMQFGEWSTQAIIAALIEVSVFVVGGLLFLVYNYWLLMKVSEDQRDAAGVSQEVEEEEEEDEFGTMWGKDENSKKKKKKKKKLWGGRGRKKGGGGGGWFRRLGEAGRKRPIAAGSVV